MKTIREGRTETCGREGREGLGKSLVARFADYRLLITVYFFILAACTGHNLDAPPEIAYGRDVCTQCGMIISEAQFAASYTTQAGDIRLFESIEDMAMYHIAHQEDVHMFWVHDYETEEWVKGNEAVYILSETIMTPMGGGVVAVADEAGAEKLVAEGDGTAVSLDQLLTLAEAGMLGGHEHSMSH